MVRHSDYAELEDKYAALAADNDKAMESLKQADAVVKLAHEKFSALASENAGLKSALNDILQPDAAVLERNHRVRALDAMETPATDAFLAEVRASGVDAAIEHLHKKFGGTGHIGVSVMALEWLAQEIRKGGAA
ncbi:gp43 [Salmonella enterica subsp. enterica serovar Paratyphi C str. RKS4594]|uniref:Gp43 n=2 Tax=Salmonella enterica TaxID=28901 RepID=C0PZE9_SALPC|nr:gp43 [Salmonella enterica subsp. enterica serovar Paratyphi C str. RKS4594]